jgi:hypothetical protein
MSRAGNGGEREKATIDAAEAQRRGAEAAAGGAAGAASAVSDLPAPPATPAAMRRDEATIRLIRRESGDRPEPYWEARVYFRGAEAIRTVGTSRHAALGGAYAALSAQWLADAK